MIFSGLSPSERNELWAVLALRHARGLGPAGAARIIAAYGGAYDAVEAGLSRPTEWAKKELASLPVARAFAGGGWRDKAGEEWNGIKSADLSFIFQSDPAYPQLLLEPVGAPLLLYFKGDLSLLRGPAVGVVGARNCTSEGLAVSAFFARNLARAGVTVISGMARGIDRAAHLAGLEGPGRSIGVLGTGIDVVYPSRNADLYARMEKDGLLVSEFAPGTGPKGKNFPIRNRLISGLALGILVVEAAGRSGSLITARLALEQNRDVFAVPGSAMSPMSEGCRELIRKGAKAVFDADDILLELAPLLLPEVRAALEQRAAREKQRKAPPARDALPAGAGKAPNPAGAPHVLGSEDAERNLPPHPAGVLQAREKKRQSPPGGVLPRAKVRAPAPEDGLSAPGSAGPAAGPPPLQGDEARVFSALGAVPRHIDEIAHTLGMDAGGLSAVLTMLEMRRLVRRLPGMLYALPE
ncbi:MAG: DNA-processing protein DprA [Desulfovibrio sp.]|jgi:DNA processing protein|nr:DNA-processing protein DprA [Desulfovibrio sp.]